jgi:hypothetical protein
LFGTPHAAGQHVEFRQRGRPGRYEVIGVTPDIKYFNLRDEPPLLLFDPAGLGGGRWGLGLAANSATVLVRAADGRDGGIALRSAAASLGAPVPLTITPMGEAVQRARLEWDVLAWLMIALAAIASVLSAVGVYGLVAFGAAMRRAEFGVRTAFGAGPGVIRQLVLLRASRLALAGLAFGLAGAYALARALAGRLVGVEPFDPLLWAMAAAGLVAIVFAASFLPARRAARVNPADTLRAI